MQSLNVFFKLFILEINNLYQRAQEIWIKPELRKKKTLKNPQIIYQFRWNILIDRFDETRNRESKQRI